MKINLLTVPFFLTLRDQIQSLMVYHISKFTADFYVRDIKRIFILSVIFRTGFTGPDCSQIVDPCLMNNPCKHGADCVPLQLGRYKCKCLPGWTGPVCSINIGHTKLI